MRSMSRKRHPAIGWMLSVLLAAGGYLAAASPAAAQDRLPPPPSNGSSSHGGRDVGMAVGIGIGIGILGLVLHNMATSHAQPQASVPTDRPPRPPRHYRPEHPRLSRRGGHGGNNGRSGMPRRGERRFVPDEVLVEFSAGTSAQTIARIARRYRLQRLEAQNFDLVGTTVYRWRITSRRSVRAMIRALAREHVVAWVQPNYLYALQQQAPANSAAQAEAAQYALGKMQIEKAHQIAVGRGVPVAVIDSEIDDAQPGLGGSIVKSFDALGGQDRPYPHGTAMAGAIAAHGALVGVAPGAQILAARAFGGRSGSARGTSYAIYKSLKWAVGNRARVINMSFAGPDDPSMDTMLAAARAKNIVLVAAAGNAGPKSPPLYPAADRDVIAVTATDSNDRLFRMANRGRYVTLAAPGVEVLSLAPDNSYQISTGTSIAAAEVSGVAALLLEHRPSLKPAEVRAILTATAKPLGGKRERRLFGAGLVNAYRAVLAANGKVARRD